MLVWEETVRLGGIVRRYCRDCTVGGAMGCIVGGTHREVLKGYFWEVLLGMPIRAYSAAMNCPTCRNDDDHEK